MIDVGEGGLRERAQRLVLDHQHVAAQDLLHPHTLVGELAIGRLVGAEREQRRVVVGRQRIGDGGVHGGLLPGLKLPVPLTMKTMIVVDKTKSTRIRICRASLAVIPRSH